MFNWFKKKKVPLRLFCIGDVVVPQIYDDDGFWKGINKKGETWFGTEMQIEYCGLPTAEEAEKFLRPINIIYPKGL